MRQSAIQARRILNLQSIATLSTVFPGAAAFESRPSDVGGSAVGLMEYYASCSPHVHNPTLLAVSIASTFKNSAAGSNVTFSLRYHPPSNRPWSADPFAYSPANLPRFSLIGHVEPFAAAELAQYNVSECFLGAHPDAEVWKPGNDIHTSWWGRLIVDEIYFFGGFGDRAWIGWIPVETWRSISAEEVEGCKLAGEDGAYGSGNCVGAPATWMTGQ